jgi:hypothetical protein
VSRRGCWQCAPGPRVDVHVCTTWGSAHRSGGRGRLVVLRHVQVGRAAPPSAWGDGVGRDGRVSGGGRWVAGRWVGWVGCGRRVGMCGAAESPAQHARGAQCRKVPQWMCAACGPAVCARSSCKLMQCGHDHTSGTPGSCPGHNDHTAGTTGQVRHRS